MGVRRGVPSGYLLSSSRDRLQGVKELHRSKGLVYKWAITKPQLLEMDFEECERHPGVFDPPVIPPGRPRTSKTKPKDPGARLKALKFHEVTF